jgi:hypothetical protein
MIDPRLCLSFFIRRVSASAFCVFVFCFRSGIPPWMRRQWIASIASARPSRLQFIGWCAEIQLKNASCNAHNKSSSFRQQVCVRIHVVTCLILPLSDTFLVPLFCVRPGSGSSLLWRLQNGVCWRDQGQRTALLFN